MTKHLRAAGLMALLLILTLALAACGGSRSNDPAANADFIYLPDYYALEGLDGDISAMAMDGADGLWFISYGVVNVRESLSEEELAEISSYYDDGVIPEDEMKYYLSEYGTGLYHCKVDGSELTQLTNYSESSVENGSTSTYALNALSDGTLMLLQEVYNYEYDDEGNPLTEEDNYYAVHLDTDGSELGRFQLTSDSTADYVYFSNMAVDKDNNVYVCDDASIIVYSQQGEQLAREALGENNWCADLISDGSGQVWALNSSMDGMQLKPVAADGSLGEGQELPNSVYEIFPASGDFDLCYQNGSDLYALDLSSGKEEWLLNWLDSDVDTNETSNICLLPDGRVFLSSSSWEEDATHTDLILLSKHDRAEVAAKTELTLAALWMNYDLRPRIIEFNRTNPDYRIKVREYSVYNTEDDYNAGRTKLLTELAAGDIPDIILMTPELPVERLTASGLLTDLGPLVEADPDIQAEDLLLNVLGDEAGHIWQAAPSFALMTMVGRGQDLGDRDHWSMADMQELAQAHPDVTLMPNTTQENFLYTVTALSLNEFIDWESGECSFDSPDFIEMLKFAAQFPAEFDWEKDYIEPLQAMMDGNALVTEYSFYDVNFDLAMVNQLLNNDVCFIGYPTQGESGCRVTVDGGLAISEACENKEAAWSFVRSALLPETQQEMWGLPTNRQALEKRLDDAIKSRADENNYSTYGFGNGQEVKIPSGLSAEEADQMRALIESASGSWGYDDELQKIITEEAAAFFAGQRSAEDAAANIQSRVSLYVSEQL